MLQITFPSLPAILKVRIGGRSGPQKQTPPKGASEVVQTSPQITILLHIFFTLHIFLHGTSSTEIGSESCSPRCFWFLFSQDWRQNLLQKQTKMGEYLRRPLLKQKRKRKRIPFANAQGIWCISVIIYSYTSLHTPKLPTCWYINRLNIP